MKIHFTTIGLALCVVLAPIGALAQDTGSADSSLGETSASPDSNVPDTSANPFTGAAGADKYYQDNSFAGPPQSNNTGTAGIGGSPSSQAATLPAPGDSTAADTANPFAGAAGANRFYQDNSLTGSMPTTSLGSLGNLGSLGGSGMANWATTP